MIHPLLLILLFILLSGILFLGFKCWQELVGVRNDVRNTGNVLLDIKDLLKQKINEG